MADNLETYAHLLELARRDLHEAGHFKVAAGGGLFGRLARGGGEAAADLAQTAGRSADDVIEGFSPQMMSALKGVGFDPQDLAGMSGDQISSLGKQWSHLQGSAGLSPEDAMQYLTTQRRMQNMSPQYFQENPMLEYAARQSGQHGDYFRDLDYLAGMDQQIAASQRRTGDQLVEQMTPQAPAAAAQAAPTATQGGAPFTQNELRRAVVDGAKESLPAKTPPTATQGGAGNSGGAGMRGLLPGLAAGAGITGLGAGALMHQQQQQADQQRNMAFGAGLAGGAVAPKLISGVGNLLSGNSPQPYMPPQGGMR